MSSQVPLASCPPPAQLERFLLGSLDDDVYEPIEVHLSQCGHCQKQLAKVAAEDELVHALQADDRGKRASSLVEVDANLIELLTPQFKRIALLQENRSTTGFEKTLPLTIGPAASDARTLPYDATLPESDRLASAASSLADDGRPRFLGPYEVQGVLGAGGMGTVLRGYDSRLRRNVAIKVVQSNLLHSPQMADLMLREARAAAAVEHDHIVPIHSVEIHGGMPCIVMPLLAGETLNDRLERAAGPLPLKDIVRIAREATSGLAAAHERGLIHCDIKPGNLWLQAPDGRLKILDFGLAVRGGTQEAKTGAISGTPGYLAPEQARGQALDNRTDLFSLGCVFYRMATGRAPFTGEPKLCALWTVLSDPPLPAQSINPLLPAALSDLIQRMLAQEPSARPASAAEVLKVLEGEERRWAEQARRTTRRRWIAATAGIAAVSCGLAYLASAPSVPDPVEISLLGDAPPLAIVLRHEGIEQPLTLAARQTLALLPGDYTIRAAAPLEGRQLVPDRFSVIAGKPLEVPIAYVGEIAQDVTHSQAVTGLAVTADSKPPQVFSVGLDRALVAWAPSEAESSRFADLPHSTRCVAVSPDGKLAATAGGNKQPPIELGIRLWHSQFLTEVGQPLEGHTRIVTAIAWSPRGVQLASAAADGVRLWNWKSGESQALLQDEPSPVHALAYSADGQRLLTGSGDGAVTMWKVETRTPIVTRKASAAAIRAVAFLPEGWAAAGDDGFVRIGNETDSDPKELNGHTSPVLAIAVSSDGKQLLSGDADGLIRVWSVAAGQAAYTLQGHDRGVNSLAFLNARQVVSGGADRTVRLWQLPFP